MKAQQLKEFDLMYHLHLMAFKNFQVKAMRKVGKGKSKPVYSTFDKFFNYDKLLNKILGVENDSPILQRLRSYMKNKKGDN